MAQRSGGGPEPLGDPPNDLSARPLPLVPYSGTAYRIHWVDHAPIHFGKEKKWRFDDPLGEYGVMYASHTPEGAFAETLLPPPGFLTPTLSLIVGSVPVSATTIGGHALAEVRCKTILHCVDLTGEKLVSVGADASIAAGAWRISQRWSRAFFMHPSQPDALMYRSRRDPSSLALALHDRAGPKIRVTSLGGLLEPQHTRLLAQIVDRYRVAIIPS